jgi:hypothetical protein
MSWSKIFGGFAFGSKSAPRLPRVDHIVGARFRSGPDGQPAEVVIQYRSATDHHEISLDWANAMFLLSLLKGMQLDTKTPD